MNFIEYIPYIPAIGLLVSAWNGTFEKQLIDAGDGVDVTKFVEALRLFHGCCEKWECTIMYPVQVNIASPVATVDKEDEKLIEKGVPEKKSLWKRLFGK